MHKKVSVPSTNAPTSNHPPETNSITNVYPQDPQRLIRINQVLTLIPVSRSCWWQWVRDGKAPQPIHLGDRCTCWRYSDVIALAK